MKRVSIVLDEPLYSAVKIISESLDRSINYTVSILLQQAIKERQRKKKLPLQDDSKSIQV